MDSFTCMTCQKKTKGSPVMVPLLLNEKVGLCGPCSKIVRAFGDLLKKAHADWYGRAP
jgi:hypothetical protein